ncbi:hypothetical protein GCM10008915_67070 [Bifidobacterium pullorum subsp. gallinarum]
MFSYASLTAESKANRIWKKLCIAITLNNMIHYKSSREMKECDGTLRLRGSYKNLKNSLKKPLALPEQT